ncbi:hypothetical protein [Dawidia soli]|nr:hypothetical protein [Dawidia soli]
MSLYPVTTDALRALREAPRPTTSPSPALRVEACDLDNANPRTPW